MKIENLITSLCVRALADKDEYFTSNQNGKLNRTLNFSLLQ